MRNVAKKYNPSEENAAIIVSINKYGRVLSNWDYLIEIKKLEDRIDKAIKFLKLFDENSTLIDHSVIKGALTILKGSDKE